MLIYMRGPVSSASRCGAVLIGTQNPPATFGGAARYVRPDNPSGESVMKSVVPSRLGTIRGLAMRRFQNYSFDYSMPKLRTLHSLFEYSRRLKTTAAQLRSS